MVQGSNPDSFACNSRIFTILSGMSERSFCIFRRIHVRLPLASQITYEYFPFTAVPQTDLKHFNLESSLGNAWLTGKSTPTGLDTLPEAHSHGYAKLSSSTTLETSAAHSTSFTMHYRKACRHFCCSCASHMDMQLNNIAVEWQKGSQVCFVRLD